MSGILFISFELAGTSVEPAHITELLQISPDTELARGQRNAALVLPRRSRWAVRSSTNPALDISGHWAEIAPGLVAKRDVLRDLASDGEATLTIVIPGSTTRCPPILIPVAMSAFAGHVGAVIDIDHLQA